MPLGRIVRKHRQKAGLTQEQLSLRVGISKPYLSNIETGRAKNPPSDGVLRAIENNLGFTEGELVKLAHMQRTPLDVRQKYEMLQARLDKLQVVVKRMIAGRTLSGSPNAKALADVLSAVSDAGELSAGRIIPVINTINTGYPHHFVDMDYPAANAVDYLRCPDVHDATAFAVRVADEAMTPKYMLGDIVVFSPATEAVTGDDCFIRFAGGRTTFRKVDLGEPDKVRLIAYEGQPDETITRSHVDGIYPAVFKIQPVNTIS